MFGPVSRRLSTVACVVVSCLSDSPGAAASGSVHLKGIPAVSPPVMIVIGFAGGFVAHDAAIHGEVRLSQRLSASYAGLHVRMFENRRGQEAFQEIRRLLDADHDGALSPQEKSRARIAIYGHSWGASETVTLARALARDLIPVQLTVQVDSVQKPGEDDAVIPPNVLQAVNFYQSDGLLHGRSQIRAADASSTRILGNFQCHYKAKPVSCEGYPWFARIFMRPHIEIEADASVWQRVETLIRSALLLEPEK